MDNITFTEAVKEDIPELIRMRISYMIDDFGSITEEERIGMEKQLPGYFEKHLGKDCIAFVAKDGAKIVSVALLIIMEKPANPFFIHGMDSEVLSVFTEKEYRHQGLCSALMSRLIEYAKEQGIDRVDLGATNEGYPIYKKVGFVDKDSKYKSMKYEIKW